jgi:hypothetical protein
MRAITASWGLQNPLHRFNSGRRLLIPDAHSGCEAGKLRAAIRSMPSPHKHSIRPVGADRRTWKTLLEHGKVLRAKREGDLFRR